MNSLLLIPLNRCTYIRTKEKQKGFDSMNIKQAKEQVKNTVKVYLKKNRFGDYVIPANKQRPVFLMGPPGIGKTEIMSQVASELGIGLLSYSMTHHTRQSAIGLPIIKKKIYDGKEYDVSEYTMSEIIASVHNMIEETGKKTGILFLDEINCVSETLSPIMLQFLQYKVFGGHTIPEGWIVVTAGNPPEYNNSVHEFDTVTWDRLKRIDIEPDFDVWKEYAYEVGVHPAIITYLETKTSNFYKIETTVDGKTFVTARGWDDLSRIIKEYEEEGIIVDKDLISQYLHNDKISRDFAVYYDLYKKYKSDYHIEDIITGRYTDELVERANEASYDEKFSIVGLLIEKLGDDAKRIMTMQRVFEELVRKLKVFKDRNDVNIIDEIETMIKDIKETISNEKRSHSLSERDQENLNMQSELLTKYIGAIKSLPSAKPYDALALAFNKDSGDHKKNVVKVKEHYTNAFNFGDSAFGDDSQQMLIMCTEMVANTHISTYIATMGCEEYFNHDDLLMFHKRNIEIIKDLNALKELRGDNAQEEDGDGDGDLYM